LASNIALLYITHLEAIKSGIKGLAKADVPNLFKTLKGGVHFFIPIIAMFYELFVLRRSAEVAAFWTIMLLIAIIFTSSIRKGMVDRTPVKEILKGAGGVILEGFVAGSKNMVPVALACASAGIIVGLVNLGIGGMITQIVETMSGGNFVLLLVITAFASLILGMGLPTTATYIVMASLTAPIIVELAGNHNVVVPLLSAHLFCFYFGILADDTPPVGLASFAAAAIAKSPPVATCIQAFKYDVRTAIIPFMFMFNTNILLFGITSWGVACLILVMTALGACAFASAVQGWCFGRNGMWDTFLLLLATLIFFNPHWFASIGAQFLDIHAYFYYLVGIGLVAWLYFTQTRRDLANAV
jgi:TRAP transporter 4TM/12TM fusion protein